MIPDAYNWKNFKKGMRNPSLLTAEAQRLYMEKFSERYFKFRYGQGIDVIEQDWDNLVILDALRFDIFKRFSNFEEKVDYVISQASTSLDFVKSNFGGKKIHDTIYVTANGWHERLSKDPFFLTKKAYSDFNQRDEYYAPEHVYQLTIDTFEKYPDKRYIVHFMQPHEPYLGKKAEDLRNRLETEENLTFKAAQKALNKRNKMKESSGGKRLNTLLDAAREGYISEKELQEIYVENLEIVLPYVEKIQKNLGGKTIITSDHGELLGEKVGPCGKKIYGHPGDLATLSLRKVPWLELESGPRREVQLESPIESEIMSYEKVKQSLKELGYY